MRLLLPSGCLLLLLIGNVATAHSRLRGSGGSPPVVTPTKGEVWPKPQLQRNFGDTFLVLRLPVFRFQITAQTCDTLEAALKRYYGIILKTHSSLSAEGAETKKHSWKGLKGFKGYLDTLRVHLDGPCEEWPSEDMEEIYQLRIDSPDLPGNGSLIAGSIWGILRGLETFSQLLFPTDDFLGLQIRSTLIMDYPRFQFRSLLIDTSRHFIAKKIIFQNLDLMAMNKMNVFHWHIVDDESFPFQSSEYPGLSEKGAYRQYTHVYTSSDVKDIIEYARLRGIRVIPEFDTPGHMLSWGLSQPGLLTQCYSREDPFFPDGTYGPIDPSRNETYAFLSKFFREIAQTFPDKYLHLGGDEVEKTCWASNPKILDFMKRMNFSSDYNRLEGFYMENLLDILHQLPQNKTSIVWQDVFDNSVRLDKATTIIHVWKSPGMAAELYNVTAAGYRVLLSSCWYLDAVSGSDSDWKAYYTCDPEDFGGTEEQIRRVLGGGAAIWTEFTDSANLISRVWPRAAAPAEKLWSAAAGQGMNLTAVASRLEEHRCRLLRRGYLVEPVNWAGSCPVDWNDLLK